MKTQTLLATLLLASAGFAQSPASSSGIDNPPTDVTGARIPMSPRIARSIAPPPKPEELGDSSTEKIETFNGNPQGDSFLQPGGGYDVGIIPETASCPSGSERIMIYMDDEDDNNADSISGWHGAIAQNHNTQFVFCRIDGRMLPFRTYPYEVLSLDSSCPTGTTLFKRTFQNESHNNQNSYSGNIYPNESHSNHSDYSWTRLNFCFYPGSGLNNPFPDLGIGYGVFAAPYFYGALATGTVHTDDEDNNNQDDFEPGNPSSAIISGANNTDMNLAKVSSSNGPHCTDKVRYYDGTYLTASWDGANCYIKPVPTGATPFIYNNAYYITADKSNQCLAGHWDGANCYLMPKPSGGFLSNDAFYFNAGPGNFCSIGQWNGTYCVDVAPWGTHAFEWQNGWYFTPLYTCKDGAYDGANCYIMQAPPFRTAFIYNRAFYYAL